MTVATIESAEARDSTAGKRLSKTFAAEVQEALNLIRTIKTLVAKGDKAREKSDQYYIAAGQHLKTLKREHSKS